MSNQKIRPCPKCQSDERVAVYKYDSGWCHVECNKCFYLGPGEGSIKQAIKSHNERVASTPSPAHSRTAIGQSENTPP